MHHVWVHTECQKSLNPNQETINYLLIILHKKILNLGFTCYDTKQRLGNISGTTWSVTFIKHCSKNEVFHYGFLQQKMA